MSETTRTPLKPAEIRGRALALMKQCWKTLLIAAVLMSLLDWAADCAAQHGEIAAVRAEQAVFAEFEAANPRPDDPDALADWETERIVHAYFSSADLTAARIKRQWTLIGYAINLVGSMFIAVVMVGLYSGLLSRLRGGACTPSCLFSKARHWKRIIWLNIRITASILGWGMLFMLPVLMLGSRLGTFGESVGILVLMWVLFWAELRYTFVLPHMADDAEAQLTTTACLDAGVQDMRFFTTWGLIRTLWPVYLITAMDIVLSAAVALIPWLSIPSSVFSVAADIFTHMACCACYAFIFEELQQSKSSARALVAPSPED